MDNVSSLSSPASWSSAIDAESLREEVTYAYKFLLGSCNSEFQKITNAPELIDVLCLRRIFSMRPLSVRRLRSQAFALWFGGWLVIGGFGFRLHTCPGFSSLFASGSSGPFSSSGGSCIGLTLSFCVRLEL